MANNSARSGLEQAAMDRKTPWSSSAHLACIKILINTQARAAGCLAVDPLTAMGGGALDGERASRLPGGGGGGGVSCYHTCSMTSFGGLHEADH